MQQHDTKNAGRNSIGLCHFLAYNNDQSLDLLNAVTGWVSLGTSGLGIFNHGLNG